MNCIRITYRLYIFNQYVISLQVQDFKKLSLDNYKNIYCSYISRDKINMYCSIMNMFHIYENAIQVVSIFESSENLFLFFDD